MSSDREDTVATAMRLSYRSTQLALYRAIWFSWASESTSAPSLIQFR